MEDLGGRCSFPDIEHVTWMQDTGEGLQMWDAGHRTWDERADAEYGMQIQNVGYRVRIWDAEGGYRTGDEGHGI